MVFRLSLPSSQSSLSRLPNSSNHHRSPLVLYQKSFLSFRVHVPDLFRLIHIFSRSSVIVLACLKTPIVYHFLPFDYNKCVFLISFTSLSTPLLFVKSGSFYPTHSHHRFSNTLQRKTFEKISFRFVRLAYNN